MKRTLVIVGLGLIGGARTAQGAARVPNLILSARAK